ncbi:MAG: CARDB domain-containing protein, partial [Thermoplasmata archaeon]
NKLLCNATTDNLGMVANIVVPIFVQKSSTREEKTPYMIHVEKDAVKIESRVFLTSGIITIIIDGRIDIEIEPSNITWFPERPAEQQSVSINVSINNLGYETAHSILVALYVDEEKIDECTIDSITGGAISKVTFTWLSKPGSHTISVNASCSEKEINNGNNRAIRSISVNQNMRADLTINSFSRIYSIYYAYNSYGSTNTKPGDFVGFVGEIWCRVGPNENEILEVEDVEIAFFVDNAKLPEKVIVVERLPTSKSSPFYWGYDENNPAALRVYFIWEAKVGTHQIVMKVDPNNNISEIYSSGAEDNNERECTITINSPSIIEEPSNFALVGICCMFPVVLTGIIGIVFLYLLRKPVTQPATQRPYYYQGRYLQNIVPTSPSYYYSTYRNQYGNAPYATQYYYNPVTRSWVPSQNQQYYQSYQFYQRQYASTQPTPKYYYNPYTRSWVPYPQPQAQTQTYQESIHERLKKQFEDNLTLKRISKASISGRKSARIGEDSIKEFEPAEETKIKPTEKEPKLEVPQEKVAIAQIVDAKIVEAKIIDAKVADGKIEEKVKEEVPLQSKTRESMLESGDMESEQKPHKKVFIVRNCPKCKSENIEIIEDSKVKCNSCGRLFRMKTKS